MPISRLPIDKLVSNLLCGFIEMDTWACYHYHCRQAAYLIEGVNPCVCGFVVNDFDGCSVF